jgi:hypothetical protein
LKVVDVSSAKLRRFGLGQDDSRFDSKYGAGADIDEGSATVGASKPSNILRLKHPHTGRNAQAPLGYSIPVALLGPLPLLWRRSWPLALCTLLVSVALPVVGQLYMASLVNRLHLQRLLRRGYRAQGRFPGEVSTVEWNLGIKIPRYRGPERR